MIVIYLNIEHAVGWNLNLKTQNVAFWKFFDIWWIHKRLDPSVAQSALTIVSCSHVRKTPGSPPLFLHCKQVTEKLGGKLGTWLRTHPSLTSSYDNFNGWQGRVDEVDLYLICACGEAIDGCLISSILSSSPHPPVLLSHVHICI